MSMPLTTRLAMWFAIAATAICGGTIAVCAFQQRELIHQSSDLALSTAQGVQKFFLLQRARQLESASTIVARNPNFAGYVAHAFGDGSPSATVDVASIRDLIGERRDDIGADLIAVLTSGGKLVAASGEGANERWDLSGNSTLELARKSNDSVSGFLVQGPRLMLITCTSIRHGTDIQAFLLAAQVIDANVIAQATRLSNASLAILQQTGTTWQVVRSDADARATAQLPEVMQNLMADDAQSAASARSGNVETDVGVFVFRATPVDGVDGHLELVSLLPPTFRSGFVRAIVLPLAAFAAMLLVLLLVASVLAWRFLTRPLDHLANLSARAEKGDHALEFGLRAKGVVGRIAGGFNYLTHELVRYRVRTGTPTRRATDRRAG
jgi:HAMP domain-containing protein